MISADHFTFPYNPLLNDASMIPNNPTKTDTSKEYLSYNPKSNSLYFSKRTEKALPPSKALDLIKRQHQAINLESLFKLKSLGIINKKIYAKTEEQNDDSETNMKSKCSLSKVFYKIFCLCRTNKPTNSEIILKIQEIAKNEILYRNKVLLAYNDLRNQATDLYLKGRFDILSKDAVLLDKNAMDCKKEILKLLRIHSNDAKSTKSAKWMLQKTEAVEHLKSIKNNCVTFDQQVSVHYIE